MVEISRKQYSLDFEILATLFNFVAKNVMLSLTKICLEVVTVSYTHLDVYKRQSLHQQIARYALAFADITVVANQTVYI